MHTYDCVCMCLLYIYIYKETDEEQVVEEHPK